MKIERFSRFGVREARDDLELVVNVELDDTNGKCLRDFRITLDDGTVIEAWTSEWGGVEIYRPKPSQQP